MPRFAANLTMMFTELPFLDRFAAAAEAGFSAVEFLFPYVWPAEEIRARAKAAGVEIVLFNMPPGDWAAGERGTSIFEARRAEFSEGLAQALHYAQVLAVPRLHLMAGIAPSGSAPHAARYREALTEAALAAAPLGLTILIEPLNPIDVPGYFLNDFNAAADMIAEMALPNLRLQFDIYHRQLMHGNVMNTLRDMKDLIGHIQTASVPLRHEPGSGELDDYAIFRHLDAIGFQGFVGCEYRPRTTTAEGLDWLVRL